MKMALPQSLVGFLSLFGILYLTSASQSDAAVVPKGSRLLGFDVNPTADGNYVNSFAAAKGAGMQVTSLVVYWDEIETEPGVYSPSPNWLSIANAYYPSQNTQVLLTVVPADTIARHVPADLDGRNFDDPVVIERFKACLDFVFSQIPEMQLTALAIGNEPDIYLGNDVAAWAQYRDFYAASAQYARTLRPGLKVGVQMTHDSAVGAASALFADVNQFSDVLIMSYYPLWSNFTVKPPTVVRADWDLLMRLHPSKPVMFAQLGYPSSATNGSSLTRQKVFIDNVFSTWDVYADRVPLVVFLRMNDTTASVTSAWTQYYGIFDPRFASFLTSLGLRTSSGTAKPAFTALRQHAANRGW